MNSTRSQPALLQPGDHVAVVAPASRPDPARLEAGLDRLRAWKLVPRPIGLGHPPHRYLAATDEQRLTALAQALADPEVRAVWAARGGYGTVRLAARGPGFPARSQPPVVVGFSDISLLLALAADQAGWPALHAPNVTTLADLDLRSLETLREFLFVGRRPAIHGLTAVHPGAARGRLVVFNLSILCSVLGTPLAPRLDHAILVLEDCAEAAYRLDRLLMQLSLSPAFSRVAGLALGDLDEAGNNPRLRQTLEEVARKAAIPCCTGVPVGHRGPNWPLPYGASARLDAQAGTLEIDPLESP